MSSDESIRMAKIKKKILMLPNAGEDVEKMDHLTRCWWEIMRNTLKEFDSF